MSEKNEYIIKLEKQLLRYQALVPLSLSNKDDDVLFYLEQVKFYLNEYENVLLEINDFISMYDQFVAKQKNSQNDGCASFYKENKEIFTRIEAQLKTVKDNFKIVYEENRIDKNTKRILFGF